MVVVSIKFAPREVFLYGVQDPIATVVIALADGKYVEGSAQFAVPGNSATDSTLDLAEEVFDLTNNPSRQEERERLYGLGRSLSSGDVVIIGEKKVLCLPCGWAEL